MDDLKSILGLIISLSTVLGIFTGIINKIFNAKLKPIEAKIDENEKEDLKDKMASWRFHVCSFAGDLRNGVYKTSHEYEAIFQFMDKYENAVEKLNIKNNLFTQEEEYIRKCYQALKK